MNGREVNIELDMDMNRNDNDINSKLLQAR